MNHEPFNTPEGYFDELPAKIKSRCMHKHEHKPYSTYLKMASYAAVLLIPMGVMLFVFNYQHSHSDISYYNLSPAVMEDVVYLADVQDINEEDIVTYISEDNTPDYTSDRQDEIIDYINNETDNYLDIFELFN